MRDLPYQIACFTKSLFQNQGQVMIIGKAEVEMDIKGEFLLYSLYLFHLKAL